MAGYVAGDVPAERVVAVVAEAYYGSAGGGRRELLAPLMDVVERAHPGVVALTGTADRPGFAVRLAERPFPKRCEAEFRQAVLATLASGYTNAQTPPASRLPSAGVLSRIVRAVRRLFTASA